MVRRQLPGQPSLFGVAATDPSPEDLAGLLAGPGTLRRMGGTAQVSVLVDAAWRVHVLVAELSRRDLPNGWEPRGEGYLVRTAFTTQLVPLANAWSAGLPEGGPTGPEGAEVSGEPDGPQGSAQGPGEPDRLEGPTGLNGRKCPPSGLHLGGQALRLWVAAAGSSSPDGYVLRLGADDGASWPAVGAALSAAGLAAALLLPGAAGPVPAYRITGRRRLARLAELVGEAPTTAPPDAWPAVPAPPITPKGT